MLLILGTVPEELFDKSVQFASTEFDVPIVLIRLLERETLLRRTVPMTDRDPG